MDHPGEYKQMSFHEPYCQCWKKINFLFEGIHMYIHIHKPANLLKCCLKPLCCFQQIFYVRNLVTKISQEAKDVKYFIEKSWKHSRMGEYCLIQSFFSIALKTINL